MAKRASLRAAGGAPKAARATGKAARSTTARGAQTETKATPPVQVEAKPPRKAAKAAAAKAAAVKPAASKPVATKAASAGKSRVAKAAEPAPPSTAKAKSPDVKRPAASGKAGAAGKAAPAKAKAAKRSAANGTKLVRAKKPARPRYLAAELGTPVDHDGEPVGAGSARARSDEELQKYALDLWRQMQSGRVVNRYTRAIERAGLTVDEVWTAGLAEERTTTSTPDELRRYRQKLLFRANLLEAIFIETIAVLRRLDNVQPAELAAAGSS